MKNITFEEAKKHIQEWGVESDNYIVDNLEHSMNGGDPDDNSIQLHEYHQKCLQKLVDSISHLEKLNQQSLDKISRLNLEIMKLRKQPSRWSLKGFLRKWKKTKNAL